MPRSNLAPRRRSKAWAVLISGRGSNLQALLDLAPEVDIRRVYSSSPKAAGLRRARRSGVPARVLKSPIDWEALDRELRQAGIECLFLAGFMRLVPESFVNVWRGRILNVHPSLLPAYPGLKSFERSWSDGAPVGASVHVVVPELDAGPVLGRRLAIAADPARATGEFETRQAQRRLSRAEQALVRDVARRWGR